jgi:hypothetical protein
MTQPQTPLLLIAGQVVPPYLAKRLIAGYADACVDQNGSDYKLFTPPRDPNATPQPAGIVRRVTPTGDMTADAKDAPPGALGTVA